MSDLDVGDEIDALEADETDDDSPGPTLTIARPTPAGTTDVTDVDLEDAGIDWPALVQAAVAAKGTADFDHYRWPRAIDGCAARLLFAWCRSPFDPPRVGVDAVTDGVCDNRLPWYPAQPDKPVVGLRTIWEALQRVDPGDPDDDWVQAVIDVVPELGCDDDPDDDELDNSPFMWWPMTVTVDHEPGRHRTWVYLHDAAGRHAATARFDRDNHTPHAARSKPLGEGDFDNLLAQAVEAFRRSKIPGQRPVGRPPSTGSIIASLRPTERLRCAVLAVEEYGLPQAATARAVGCRADSLSRSLKRRRQRRT